MIEEADQGDHVDDDYRVRVVEDAHVDPELGDPRDRSRDDGVVYRDRLPLKDGDKEQEREERREAGEPDRRVVPDPAAEPGEQRGQQRAHEREDDHEPDVDGRD